MSRFKKHLTILSLYFFSLNLEATWVDPKVTSSFNLDVSNAMDGSSNTIAVWTEWGNSVNHIYSSKLSKADSAHWQVVDIIFFKEHTLFYYPTVAVDSSGNAVTIWQEQDVNSNSKISASTRSINGQWSIPVDLTDPTMGQGVAPQIAMNSSGYAVAIWRLNSIVQASSIQFDGTWSAPMNLGTSEGFPQIKVDGSGNSVAAWVSNGSIQTATLPYQGSWSSVVTLSLSNSLEPQLALNDSGYAIVTWAENITNSIFAATMQMGSSWSEPILLNSGDQIDMYSVAVAQNGNVVVVWTEQTFDNSSPYPIPSTKYLKASFFSDQHWSSPEVISASDFFDSNNIAFNPNVALDGQGNAIAIWNSYSQIQASLYFKSSGQWSTPTNIRNGPYGLITKPKISVDSTGYAVLNWTNELGVIESAQWFPE